MCSADSSRQLSADRGHAKIVVLFAAHSTSVVMDGIELVMVTELSLVTVGHLHISQAVTCIIPNERMVFIEVCLSRMKAGDT